MPSPASRSMACGGCSAKGLMGAMWGSPFFRTNWSMALKDAWFSGAEPEAYSCRFARPSHLGMWGPGSFFAVRFGVTFAD